MASLSRKFRVRSQVLSDPTAVRAYWWDGELNFGDLLTPFFLRKACDRNVINVRGVRSSLGDALVGVGSILHDLRYPRAVIWGSGFGKTAVKQSRLPAPSEVLALRGELSRSIARDAGWPETTTLGDPGILASRLVAPRESKRQYVIIPHHSHYDVFLKGFPGEERNIVSAKQSPAIVLRAIAESRVVLSSSLHGIIVAHSYSKPWVWLDLKEYPLYGGDFKFQDFFSGMNIVDIPSIRISESDMHSRLRSIIREAFHPAGRSVVDCQETLIKTLKISDFSKKIDLSIEL